MAGDTPAFSALPLPVPHLLPSASLLVTRPGLWCVLVPQQCWEPLQGEMGSTTSNLFGQELVELGGISEWPGCLPGFWYCPPAPVLPFSLPCLPSKDPIGLQGHCYCSSVAIPVAICVLMLDLKWVQHHWCLLPCPGSLTPSAAPWLHCGERSAHPDTCRMGSRVRGHCIL